MEPSTIHVEGQSFHNVRKQNENPSLSSSGISPNIRICGKPIPPPSAVQPLEELKKEKEDQTGMRPLSPSSSILVCGKPFSPSSLGATETDTQVSRRESRAWDNVSDFPASTIPTLTLRNVNLLESQHSPEIEEKMGESEAASGYPLTQSLLPPDQLSSLGSILSELATSQTKLGNSFQLQTSSNQDSVPIVVHIHNHTHVWEGGMNVNSVMAILLLVLAILVVQSW